METRVWLNRSQPQSLYSATLLLYLNAGFAFLFGGLGPITLAMVAAGVAGGYGTANEQKWGPALGVGVALVSILVWFGVFGIGGFLSLAIVSLMFDALLLYLFTNEESRDYQRIWFK